MKGLTVFIMLILPYCSYPQGAFTNNTHSVLQKVLADYPNGFRNIRGAQVNQDPQSIDFVSNVKIPESVNTYITRYSASDNKEIYSWKCIVFESDDYTAAERKYRSVFNELKNSIIKVEGQKPFILNGSYTNPTEEKRFTSSSLQLVPPAPGELSRVKVEITMEFLVTEWKISILVYDQREEELVMD